MFAVQYRVESESQVLVWEAKILQDIKKPLYTISLPNSRGRTRDNFLSAREKSPPPVLCKLPSKDEELSAAAEIDAREKREN